MSLGGFPSAGQQQAFSTAFARYMPTQGILATKDAEAPSGTKISDSEALGSICGQFIANEDGFVSLVMVGGQTVRFYALKGVVYVMQFSRINLTGTEPSEIACFY